MSGAGERPSNVCVGIKKNGQSASGKTRKILNRGNGLYRLINEREKDILVECIQTRWNGWLPKREIIVDKSGVIK